MSSLSAAAPSALTTRIKAAKRAVMAQTERMHREFGRVQSLWKYDGTRVTPVDVAISENIFRELAAQFPDDDLLSEELTETEHPIPLAKRFAWVLDPIDGTNNYALGIAHCAISLALLENGVPVYGVIYDMARRVLMHGGPGFGVMDGDREARVRPPSDEELAKGWTLLGFHSPTDRAYAKEAALIMEHFKIRGLGSSTLHLAYVAAGILGGTVDHNVRVWDIAAAVPLCLAAGGQVRYRSESPFPLRSFDLRMDRIRYLAGNAAVCDRLEALLGTEHAG
ncbi:MAG: inositol monophosphatase [Opitutaceae bacterium]|jgi:myo-inositol-1(or 4)-monophosphatase|nr:inositol monophosphatase [Opitutaceae bacterium]